MLNDTSSLLSHLATRRSGKPRDMIAPGPDAEQLRHIVELALRTPDHGKLAPWRIVAIGSDQRGDFAAMLKDAFRRANPGVATQDLGAIEQFAQQAPTLLAVLSKPVQPSKIPLWEQQLSAGALCMNLLHAAHAMGFVASWITGWAAFDATVASALGLSDPADRVAGFLFIGTAANAIEDRPRLNVDDILSPWQPPYTNI